MHSNADITSAQQATQELFSTILTLLPKSSSGAGKSREDIIDELAVGVLNIVPAEWDLDTVGKKYPTLYSESMNTVLLQEIIRYNRLLAVMRKSLLDICKALKGEMVMSGDLEAMGDALFNNLVPGIWEAVAYPSLMGLMPWVNDLVARANFLQKWVDEGTPKAFWISGFFFPQAFLTGSLQNYARKSGHPVDRISFAYRAADGTRRITRWPTRTPRCSSRSSRPSGSSPPTTARRPRAVCTGARSTRH
jgi:dynein heavy chain